MKRSLVLIITSVLFVSCNLPHTQSENLPQNEDLQTASPPRDAELVTISPTMDFTLTETQTQTPGKTFTPEPGFGSISGQIIGYPYGSIPQLVIVAIEQPFIHYWYLILGEGSTYFSMDGYISTGRYQIVAYDPWGHAGGCVTIIQVPKDDTVTCDISDWSGSFPSKPPGVP